jgi:hypothetical protein
MAATPTRLKSQPLLITPSSKLNYKQINDDLKDLSYSLYLELSDSEKIYNKIDYPYNTRLWTVSPNKTISSDGSPNFYLNIKYNGWDVAHLSFHMGKSKSSSGSTHIKYNDGDNNQILFDGGKLICKKSNRHIFLEDCILNVLNSSEIVNRLKYFKYKYKYLKLIEILNSNYNYK